MISMIKVSEQWMEEGNEAEIQKKKDFIKFYAHTIYGFSKDWGISGLRVGVLHTRNPEMHDAMEGVGYF